MFAHAVTIWLATAIGRCFPQRSSSAKTILLTGTFYSDNWIAAHIRPLAASGNCKKLILVSADPIPNMKNVQSIHPTNWLKCVIGTVPARLLVFTLTALRVRPDVVGGFHLLVNGLVATVLARLVNGQSMYFCVGGPMEVLDGGVHAENRIFSQMETPDPVVEWRLIQAVNHFDWVITMGTRAIDFFKQHGIESNFHVVSGGIDPERFRPATETPPTDLILVGRLVDIKRIDVFLRAVQLLKNDNPDVSAIIVGDGPNRADLEALARSLDVEANVRFVGQQANVHQWLTRAKIFVLTSDSEGLALSLMEAMTCGLPPIVTDVGDLADLVQDGVNGFLVPRRSPQALADRIAQLINDDPKREEFSQAARQSARYHDVDQVTARWDRLLVDTIQKNPYV
jgi:glycosyltransferase involved in cell wall biosynthesis